MRGSALRLSLMNSVMKDINRKPNPRHRTKTRRERKDSLNTRMGVTGSNEDEANTEDAASKKDNVQVGEDEDAEDEVKEDDAAGKQDDDEEGEDEDAEDEVEEEEEDEEELEVSSAGSSREWWSSDGESEETDWNPFH